MTCIQNKFKHEVEKCVLRELKAAIETSIMGLASVWQVFKTMTRNLQQSFNNRIHVDITINPIDENHYARLILSNCIT